jgi:hypothetical protein
LHAPERISSSFCPPLPQLQKGLIRSFARASLGEIRKRKLCIFCPPPATGGGSRSRQRHKKASKFELRRRRPQQQRPRTSENFSHISREELFDKKRRQEG